MDGLEVKPTRTMAAMGEPRPDVIPSNVTGSTTRRFAPTAGSAFRPASLSWRWRTILALGMVWIVVFTILVEKLPRRPNRRISDTRSLSLSGWHNGEWLNAEIDGEDPLGEPAFRLRINAETGSIRERGTYDDAAVARATTESLAKEGPDPAGWRVEFVFRMGEVAWARLVDDRKHVRLLVLDPRTGAVHWQREFPPCQTGRFGNRLWFESVEDAPEPFLHLVDFSTGRDVPSRLVERGIRISRCLPSFDDRFVGMLNRGHVWVWNVETGDEVLSVNAERFNFSTDSRFVATLEATGEGSKGALSEMWRVHDLSTGAVVAEREAAPPLGRPPISSFTFLDKDRAVTCGRTSGRNGGWSEVDVWRWQDEGLASDSSRNRAAPELASATAGSEIRTLRPAFKDFRPPGNWWSEPIGAVAKVLVDGPALIDTATGRRLGTLPNGYKLSRVSPGRKWAIVRSTAPAWQKRLVGHIARLAPWLAAQLPQGERTRLYDIAADRFVASLSPKANQHAAFSPNDCWLATHDGASILIWRLPASAPWKEAFAWSLLVPAAFAARRVWINRKRPGSAASAPLALKCKRPAASDSKGVRTLPDAPLLVTPLRFPGV